MKKVNQKDLPKISLITPSYNQKEFIEETITSVLSQNYPNLEYLVIDGKSSDGTLAVLKKYQGKIQYLSEKDHGQSEAINKGIKMASGEIIGYLNSDDILRDKTLWKVADFFIKNPDYYWLTGKCQIINREGKEINKFITLFKNFFLEYLRSYPFLSLFNYISQPATFWRRKVVENKGLFDEDLIYCMDYDYWLRISKKFKLGFINDDLAAFRVHRNSKTGLFVNKVFAENYLVGKRHNGIILSIPSKIINLIIILIYKTFGIYDR